MADAAPAQAGPTQAGPGPDGGGMGEASVARHSVRVVAQRTGLTPATLRAWERRYQVVEPVRSDGGQRLYSDADVERLTLLRALTDGGRPIRLIAALDAEEARALLESDRRAAPGPGGYDAHRAIAEAMALARTLDADRLQAALRRGAVSLGALAFLDQVVTPLLDQIGDAWVAGEIGPAEEHVVSVAVESVLDWITSAALESANGPMLVVGTLPGELHRLGAWLVAASAGLEGWRVTFLGAPLPGTEIARAARGLSAAAVAISVVDPESLPHAAGELRALREGLPSRTRLWVGGRSASALTAAGVPDGVLRIDGLEGLRQELRRGG